MLDVPVSLRLAGHGGHAVHRRVEVRDEAPVLLRGYAALSPHSQRRVVELRDPSHEGADLRSELVESAGRREDRARQIPGSGLHDEDPEEHRDQGGEFAFDEENAGERDQRSGDRQGDLEGGLEALHAVSLVRGSPCQNFPLTP